MKIKNVVLSIKSRKKFLSDLSKDWQKLEKGKRVTPKDAIYFESVEALRKALTPLRLEIIKTIRDQLPSSIYELAKMMKRDQRNIHQHVLSLAELGLVELKRSQHGRENIVPIVSYNEIDVRISLDSSAVA